jgi:hypothetical protein
VVVTHIPLDQAAVGNYSRAFLTGYSDGFKGCTYDDCQWNCDL